MRLWHILTGLALVFITMLALRPLLPIDETRYLSVAWEMQLSGDPIHLTKNFDLYTHKTPLLFVLINAVWLVTGVSEFAARLVGPALAVAMVAGTYALGLRLWGDRGRARDAALVLSGFTVFLLYGSATMFDALLALAVLGGIAALWRVGQGDGRGWIGFGLALAFGVYAKGPVIFVHLLPAMLALPLWAAQPVRFGAAAKGFGTAMAVALALVALWLAPALIWGTAEYRHELLWTQSAGRVTGDMAAGQAHGRPWWFLLALLPVALFPFGWSWRLWNLRALWAEGGAARLLMIWAAATLVLFSLISGKQVHYLLPAFPAMALLFARGAVQARGGSLAPVALVLLGGLGVAVGMGWVPLGPNPDIPTVWPLAVFGVVCLVLALLVWRLPLVSGHTLAGVVVALGLHGVVATTGLYAAYDGQPMAQALAAGQGLATTEVQYHAQFNFAARLTEAVATPQTAQDWAEWAKAHPQGLIFGVQNQSPLTAEPQGTYRYMGKDWAIWPASAALTFPE